MLTLSHSFESVLEAAKLGADWAWACLYGEIAGPLMGFFRCRGVSDPQEAAGDVFFEVARGLVDFEGTEESFRTFVFDIAHRRMAVENRFQPGRKRSALSDTVLDHLRVEVSGADVRIEHDVSDEIHRAFELLTAEQRDVLSLRIIAGLSLEQVSEVLHQRVKTIREIQRGGLARVRALYPAERAMA